MNTPPPPSRPSLLPQRTLTELLCCAGWGAVVGRVVLGLAARHAGATAGLVLALIFVGASVASLLLLMTHLHHVRWNRKRQLPLERWVGALAAGLLATIYLAPLLG